MRFFTGPSKKKSGVGRFLRMDQGEQRIIIEFGSAVVRACVHSDNDDGVPPQVVIPITKWNRTPTAQGIFPSVCFSFQPDLSACTRQTRSLSKDEIQSTLIEVFQKLSLQPRDAPVFIVIPQDSARNFVSTLLETSRAQGATVIYFLDATEAAFLGQKDVKDSGKYSLSILPHSLSYHS